MGIIMFWGVALLFAQIFFYVVFYVVVYIKLYELPDLKQNMTSTWITAAVHLQDNQTFYWATHSSHSCSASWMSLFLMLQRLSVEEHRAVINFVTACVILLKPKSLTLSSMSLNCMAGSLVWGARWSWSLYCILPQARLQFKNLVSLYKSKKEQQMGICIINIVLCQYS